MSAGHSQTENHILITSALLASGFAAAGIALGIMVRSMVIVFDGVYSFVSLVLTLLSLATANLIRKPSDPAFPFGRAILEPAVVAFKGAVILALVVFSLYSAVLSLFDGGREVDASIASLFGMINLLGCCYAWWYVAGKSRHFSSDIIAAEVKQWKMDTLLSLAVTLGFLAAWLLMSSSWSEYAVYADPLMMIIMSFYFIRVPLGMLSGAIRELLMMQPSQEIIQMVDEGVLAAGRETEQDIELTGVSKVGRELRVNVDIKTDSSDTISVRELKRASGSLTRSLSKLPFELRLNLNITT